MVVEVEAVDAVRSPVVVVTAAAVVTMAVVGGGRAPMAPVELGGAASPHSTSQTA